MRIMHSKGGGKPFALAYTDAQTRSYEGDLKQCGVLAMRGKAPLDAPLAVSVVAYMPIPASWSHKKQREALAGSICPTGRPDLDNLIKTMDALNGVVWRDDALIVQMGVEKKYSDRPRLVIDVSPK